MTPKGHEEDSGRFDAGGLLGAVCSRLRPSALVGAIANAKAREP